MASSKEGQGGATAIAVRAERIRTLFRQSPLILVVNPLNAALVGAVVWPSADPRLVVGWVLASALVTVLRLVLRRRYLSAPRPAEAAPLWGRRFVIGAVAAGMLWGAGAALFYDLRAPAAALIIIFVVGGMAAGAAGTLAPHLPAFYGFSASAVLPLAVRIMTDGDRLHMAMGSLGIVFCAALAFVASNSHRALSEAFRLRFENEDLLARLRTVQASLEDANRTLEQRVAERGSALERQAEALREARRMESLGLLAGGVAHDFNNLLTVMLGNALVLLSEEGFDHTTRSSLDEIRAAADRAASLVKQLLAFSRRQVMVPKVLDMNGVVSDMQRLLARLIGEHIELVVALQPGPLAVEADSGQLEQVIINLATNARDAMAGGGKVTIETEVMSVPGGGSDLAPGVAPGLYVVLSVRDTGIGMDAETRRLAFHPFFTTKEVGQGTGLGLATVYGIVEQSGGRVFVESEPGEGSCFRVFLPRSAKALSADTPPSGTRGAPIPRLSATVLLAEDDDMVRAVTSRALTGAGLTVLEADNGERALERARVHPGAIDLLVTDVVMTRMGGPELAEKMIAERPGIRVLFVSGYNRNAVLPASDVESGVDFLQKPFTPGLLIQRVARLLAVAGPQSSAAVKQPSARSSSSGHSDPSPR